MKETEILQALKMKNSKRALVISVDVPPLCLPVLVGDPKGIDGDRLRWVEKIPKTNQIPTWGVPSLNDGSIIEEMVRKALERSAREDWGVYQESFKDAQKHLKDLGIDEVKRVGDLVIPSDASLLGTVIFMEGVCFPVIHNLKRAFCVIKQGG